MKKIIALLLVLTLVLCAGCTSEEPVQPEPSQTQPVPSETEPVPSETEPPVPSETEPPVPTTVATPVKAGNVPVVLLELNRGDVIELVGDFDEDHYIAKVGDVYGMVEKNLVRTASQEAYASWTGYAYGGVAFCSDLYLQTVANSLTLNTTVEVLEDLGYGYLVSYNGSLGFMRAGSLSRNKIVYSAPSGGSDGGDISLQGGIFNLSAVPQEGEVTGEATVLADGTPLVLMRVQLDETVDVVTEEGFAEAKEGFVTVYVSGLYGYVDEKLVGETDYTAWDGYAKFDAEIFDNYYLLGEAASKPTVNTVLHLVGELDNCYLVDFNGSVGYISKDLVSATKVAVGGGGGGAEWSPPAM